MKYKLIIFEFITKLSLVVTPVSVLPSKSLLAAVKLFSNGNARIELLSIEWMGEVGSPELRVLKKQEGGLYGIYRLSSLLGLSQWFRRKGRLSNGK